jgi:hypothetical protein
MLEFCFINIVHFTKHKFSTVNFQNNHLIIKLIPSAFNARVKKMTTNSIMGVITDYMQVMFT